MKLQALLLFVILIASSICASAQIAQPYVLNVTPNGAQRGTAVTLTVDGFNLDGATSLIWGDEGISTKITNIQSQPREKPKLAEGQTGALIVDKASRCKVSIEAQIAPNASTGIHSFRVVTSLGTTNIARIVVSPFPETMEKETNDALETAQQVKLPTTLVGDLNSDGDVDSFRFTAAAGQEIVFQVIASALGSRLDSVVTLLDSKGIQLASNDDFDGRRDSLLAYAFKTSGEYVIQISDRERKGAMAGSTGSGPFFYRLNAGEFPYLTSVFPLGLRQGTSADITVEGFNLETKRVKVAAPQDATWDSRAELKYSSKTGQPINSVRLPVGRYPEIISTTTNLTMGQAEKLTFPVTVNGRIASDGHNAGQAVYFRFAARKGQQLVFEVGAQRFGSPLDSLIEILDSNGHSVPRALLRCELETSVTLNDPDSSRRGFRLLNWNGINVNDYLLVGNELLQVETLPKSPDEDTFFKSFAGQRLGIEDTTPEAHAVNTPVYKVSIHPPGTTLPSNGLPVITLYYRNDDGGPEYGKDSRLTFTAPGDGDYLVRVRDVRGLGGDRFTYRLSIHEPQPDFVLSVDPENPNVPAGSSIPLTITASRIDGFDGEITVRLKNIPAGYTATQAVIHGGQTSTAILLSGSAEARPFTLEIEGVAQIDGQQVIRAASLDHGLSVATMAPPPEIKVWTEPKQIAIEPGGHAYVTVRIARDRGFAGRVPIDVRGLPPGVIVKDVGLNGVLITESETEQRFLLDVQSWVPRLEQPIFVVGRIETTSPQRSDFPAQPLVLTIKPKETAHN